MSSENVDQLVRAGELRPARMGYLLLGRVVLGHLSTTLVDLGLRGLIRVWPCGSGSGSDWLVSRTYSDASLSGALRYERALLACTFGAGEETLLSSFDDDRLPGLKRSGVEVIKDAGERLHSDVQAFRRRMRQQEPFGDLDRVRAWLPYLLLLGLDGRLIESGALEGTPASR